MYLQIMSQHVTKLFGKNKTIRRSHMCETSIVRMRMRVSNRIIICDTYICATSWQNSHEKEVAETCALLVLLNLFIMSQDLLIMIDYSFNDFFYKM